jgi:hypothetical protein
MRLHSRRLLGISHARIEGFQAGLVHILGAWRRCGIRRVRHGTVRIVTVRRLYKRSLTVLVRILGISKTGTS